jgi:Protein of unknown function (DUF742)
VTEAPFPVGHLPRRAMVRPYVLTHGRTRADGIDVSLDAAVHARVAPDELSSWPAPEARSIVTLCREPMPVAEVAARLEMPLGVARVLVGDLAAGGLVTVSASRPADAHTDVTLLERLLDGIRAL